MLSTLKPLIYFCVTSYFLTSPWFTVLDVCSNSAWKPHSSVPAPPPYRWNLPNNWSDFPLLIFQCLFKAFIVHLSKTAHWKGLNDRLRVGSGRFIKTLFRPSCREDKEWTFMLHPRWEASFPCTCWDLVDSPGNALSWTPRKSEAGSFQLFMLPLFKSSLWDQPPCSLDHVSSRGETYEALFGK